MDVTAVCERSGDWWAISVPQVDGLFTQTKRLEQVPAMVADAVSLMTGEPADQVHVKIEAHMSESGSRAAKEWQIAELLEEQSRALQRLAAAARREAMGDFKDAGLSVRDIGELTGVSYQRVSQILSGLKNGDVVAAGDLLVGVKELLLEGREPVDIVAEVERTLNERPTADRAQRVHAG